MRDFLRGLQAEWAWAQEEFDLSPRRIFLGAEPDRTFSSLPKSF